MVELYRSILFSCASQNILVEASMVFISMTMHQIRQRFATVGQEGRRRSKRKRDDGDDAPVSPKKQSYLLVTKPKK